MLCYMCDASRGLFRNTSSPLDRFQQAHIDLSSVSMIISYSALCKAEVLRLETRPDGAEEYALQHEETKDAFKKNLWA